MPTKTQTPRPVGPTVPLDVHCACPTPRRVPVRIASDALAELRRAVLGRLDGDQPVMTYWCRHCKQVVALTARDLFLSP